MSNVTGRDGFIITEALAVALVALEQLPAHRQPQSNMNDIRRLLAERAPSSVSLHLARAKCRLFPNLDPVAVYESYGIDIKDSRSQP